MSSREGDVVCTLAEWIAEERRALVLSPRGTRITRLGSNLKGTQWLSPEEVLFLLDERALVLLIDGETASTRDAFSAIVDSPAVLRRSTTFAHMYHLGYICRHSRELPTADPTAAGAPRLNADFDVFDSTHFRRSTASSGALPPRMRVLVVGNTNPLPPFGLLRELALREPAPLTIAVVSGSDVSLLCVEAGELDIAARTKPLWATAAAFRARAPRLTLLAAAACAAVAVMAASRRARL
jgi:hypothetical protein